MPYLAIILFTLLLAVPAMSVELFRYRGAAKDGGTLEYVFEADAAEIASDFMTTLPRPKSVRSKRKSSGQRPLRFGLSAFRTRSKDHCDKWISSLCRRMGGY